MFDEILLIFSLLIFCISIYLFLTTIFEIHGDWGLGIGDWGLGIGPNPQSPNPQSPIPNLYKNNYLI